jgi:hypothetical protein
MIRAMGLVLSGLAAVGLALTGSFVVLLVCWVLGVVLQAGLVAASGSQRAAAAAREVFLVEIAGSWALALGGLALVLAADSARLEELTLSGLPDAADGALGWAGLGVLLAVVCRLGLLPWPWWPARLAGAPPVVRVFLLAGLHPATALVLWQRLAVWLLPWHLTVADWLAAVGALAAALAGAGERQAARRAAWLGASYWAALLSVGATAAAPTTGVIVLLAAGMALVQLQVALPRASLAWRRCLLAGGALATLAAAFAAGLVLITGPAAVLRLLAIVLSLWVWSWWLLDLGRRPTLPADIVRRCPPLGWLAGVARVGQGKVPLATAAGAMLRGLGRLTAGLDRIVLGGIAEGLGWMGLGIGWLFAWLDRRVLDAWDWGSLALVRAAGRGAARAASGQPGAVLAWAVAVIVLLALLGLIGH